MDTDTLAQHMLSSTLGMIDILTISLGDRLGLYQALQQHGPLSPEQLAGYAPIDQRYAREWLEQQAVAGLLEHDAGTFSLPADHIPVLLDRDSLAYLAPLANLMSAAGSQIDALEQAYRTGRGVAWSEFGRLMREGQAAGNRPWFLGPLVEDWLPSLDGLADQLSAGGHVLEIGCGEGWASIAIAEHWPDAHVDSVDIDVASIESARENATRRGVQDRVAFHTAAQSLPRELLYDLVLALECIHDMPDPVAVLAAMRRRVAPHGTVVVMDERTTDAFTGNGDDTERLLYGWSTLICLPDSMSHPDSVATGTVMRPDTLRRYAVEAGFSGVEILPIEHDLWRFYQLHL